MNSKPKRILLRISSVLMLLAALPMLLWCLDLIHNASLDYTYAGVGCFAAGIAYIFSMVTAIAGLAFAGQLHRYRWCRPFAYIQLVLGVLLIFPLRAYAVLTLPPLFLLTALYLLGVGWREKRDCEH
ncbi:MAG: hypothetical protein ACOX0K_09095 [Oscillospiraceae bacterium]|jgi:uncharacterized membrane protein